MNRIEATRSDKLHRKFLNIVKPLRRRIKADVDAKGDRLILQLGNKARFFEMDRPLPNFETFDFAVFALAAQSMRRGVPFRFDLPVSQSAANAVSRIGSIWRQRTPHFASPMDIEFTNIVADREPRSNDRILCISGGIDSTYSAIVEPSFTHGLSIRGFDFPMDNHQGFEGRLRRMQTIAEHFSLELQELRTDLSLSFKTYFDSFNVLYLATCLGFAGYGKGSGAFSGDFSAYGQLTSQTFCSSEGIDLYLSTREFPIDMIGSLPTRGEKIKTIHETAPDLLKHVGFCLDEQDQGGNCGRCYKCMRTRISLDYMDMDQTLIFDEARDPIDFFRNHDVGSAYMANHFLQHIDHATDALPDCARRREYMAIAEAMRRKYHGLRGNYIA